MIIGRVVGISATALLAISLASCGSNGTTTSSSNTTDGGSVAPSATAGTSTAPTMTTSPIDTISDSTLVAATTTSVVSSTTIDDRPVNAADQTLALAATLRVEDFPAPWVIYSPGSSFHPTSDRCAYGPDGALSVVTNGGAQRGPNMQLAETGAYASSFALAFPDETVAIDYVAAVNADAWHTCVASQLQDVQDSGGFDNVVRLVTREEPTLNESGFESYADFEIVAADGSVSRVIVFRYYRLGRVVIGTTLEYSGLSDADNETYQTGAFNALVAAYDRVNAL